MPIPVYLKAYHGFNYYLHHIPTREYMTPLLQRKMGIPKYGYKLIPPIYMNAITCCLVYISLETGLCVPGVYSMYLTCTLSEMKYEELWFCLVLILFIYLTDRA